MVDLLFLHLGSDGRICDELLEQFFIAIKDMHMGGTYRAISQLVAKLCSKRSEVQGPVGDEYFFQRTRSILEAACRHRGCTELLKLMFFHAPWVNSTLDNTELESCQCQQDLFIYNSSGNSFHSDDSRNVTRLQAAFIEQEMKIDRSVSPVDLIRMNVSTHNTFFPKEVVVFCHEIPWKREGVLPYYGIVIEAIEHEDGVCSYLVGCGYSKIGDAFDHTYEAMPFELGKIGKRLIPEPFE